MDRLTDMQLETGEAIIGIWATRGRKHWLALIECSDGFFRMMGDGCRASYGAAVTRSDAIGDIESRIHVAKVIDRINYAPVKYVWPTS